MKLDVSNVTFIPCFNHALLLMGEQVAVLANGNLEMELVNVNKQAHKNKGTLQNKYIERIKPRAMQGRGLTEDMSWLASSLWVGCVAWAWYLFSCMYVAFLLL